MTGLIIFLLAVGCVILLAFIFTHKHYTKLNIGTVVGKYLNNHSLRTGFIVVQMNVERTDSNGYRYHDDVTETYEVPIEYYNKTNMGDKGLFPY